MADMIESESAETLLSMKADGYPSVDEIKTELIDDDTMDMDDQQISNNSTDSHMDTEESDALTELGPAALGLQRVGTQPPPKPNPPTQPVQVLNRRGMPARIRKKNKLFYDDILVNHPHHRIKKDSSHPDTKQSPKKMTRPSPAKRHNRLTHEPKKNNILNRSLTPTMTTIKQEKEPDKPMQPSSPDRKIGQKIGMRLRNLLKLPKAHKWVCYEWFYSNIDKTLFEGDNDFMICLKESFPQLKTRKLTRVEWCKIRRMMGKPRRCSQSFFEEERRELERKRQKIRMLQQRKAADINSFKDLPPEIPLQLVIGTKVTARLRKPQDGLFTGSIDAVDTSNNTYRITFERAGLGTHSVPDYEVLSNEPPETISVASFAQKFRPRHVQYVPSPPYAMKLMSPRLNSDPLISNASVSLPKKSHIGGTMNGYPLKLLEFMVKVNKILSIKKIKIKKLREMNSEAEKRRSFGESLPPDFERRYAGIVVELEKMNAALQDFLNDVQELCQEMAPEPSVAAMLAPSHLREKCRQEAADMVNRNNVINDKEPGKMTQLVTDLTALMLQVKSLSDSDRNAYELKVLQGTMEQIRSKLSPQNQQVFQNCVEIHMQHIQLGLGQRGALTPFMAQRA
ncbi:protein lin-9 homolog isoform X3 [Osmia lignaria lignaria]|uniref:protein lin-9 homolog isoform X3 n=1 Tax=Osmia bicornis bicornis TaxID=1437191 RepID=UPI0010F831FD|nr:protein lin-9 homolog isoform X3 [Osmia bicornis bicornis]XP_034170935.1 protein lin-9 homolog isoform X3 [Osmia lignaria]